MIPVDQSVLHVPGVSRGNCMQAAVASILSLPLSDVPNFVEIADGDACVFWDTFHEFCVSRGYLALGIPNNWVPDCYYLVHGDSPRGGKHSVVYRAGKLAHDPHPSRAGVTAINHMHLIVPVEITTPA